MTGAAVPAAFLDHGGRVDAARAAYGDGDWIDLSTGVAPWAWPVAATPLGLDRLPEPAALTALEQAAAAAFAVDAAGVVAVPGTDLALRLLAVVLPARRPAIVRPGYAGHAAAWPAGDAIAEVAAGAEDHDLIVAASPANPDGRIVDPATAGAATLVLDQAFADPDPAPAPHGRLVVLRSFGKFHGLPGLRLGFVLAAADVAARLRRLLGDWPVSGAAIAIGTAAYRDGAWRAAQARRIADAGAALDEVLASAGLPVAGGASLFRLIAGVDGPSLFRHLAARAILTRPFADRPDRLRLGLPRDAAGLTRLATALKEYRP